jgi:hypothetical protein
MPYYEDADGDLLRVVEHPCEDCKKLREQIVLLAEEMESDESMDGDPGYSAFYVGKRIRELVK